MFKMMCRSKALRKVVIKEARLYRNKALLLDLCECERDCGASGAGVSGLGQKRHPLALSKIPGLPLWTGFLSGCRCTLAEWFEQARRGRRKCAFKELKKSVIKDDLRFRALRESVNKELRFYRNKDFGFWVRREGTSGPELGLGQNNHSSSLN